MTSRSPPFCVSTRWWACRPLPIPSKPTPRTRPCGRVFGVGLLFTSRKPKARPWGRVSGFRRLPSPSPPSRLPPPSNLPHPLGCQTRPRVFPPLPYLPNTENAPMWRVFCVWHCSTCPHLLKTKNTPSVARFSCSASPVQYPSHPPHSPSCQTQRYIPPHAGHGKHTHLGVLSVFGSPFASCVEHREHTHVGVFSVFGAPCAPPLRTGHRKHTHVGVFFGVQSPFLFTFSYCFIR